ncbi:MAG TPA: VWA domain-containing protein [Thermoanaerobaculia bacterium]|nr:VWA domain-containing protein [Thermoanaerobaculia bacterium]
MPRIAAILSLLMALPLIAQQPATPQFGEKVDVNVVLVDAVVTDATGHQILGLDKDDFLVTENGEPQKVDSLDYFTNRRLLNAQEGSAPFKAERVREDRYFIFFFDKPEQGAMWDRLRLARQASLHFVDEEMQPSDHVAVVSHDMRLKIFSDFTNDRQQLHKALDDVMLFGLGLKKPADAPAGSIFSTINAKAMVNKTGTVYEGLNVLADALRPIKARKNIILFSPGIAGPDEDYRDGIIFNRSRYYDPMIHALNAANVTVYPLNLHENAPPIPLYHQALESIATDTNGEYYRFNVSFTPQVKKVDQSNSGYYLLSYRSNHAEGTKGYQKVRVALKNPEFKVKAREGYSYGE